MGITVFQFDHLGIYTGQTLADESPLEPGVYLMPARTTRMAPPEDCPGHQWPRWNGRQWQLVNRPPSLKDTAIDPVAKLRQFLLANPDVAALLTMTVPESSPE